MRWSWYHATKFKKVSSIQLAIFSVGGRRTDPLQAMYCYLFGPDIDLISSGSEMYIEFNALGYNELVSFTANFVAIPASLNGE